MLSEAAIDFLAPLTFRATAERRSCLLPLSGIYWEDEIPDFKALLKLPEQDRSLVLRLFSIRFSIWDGEELPEADQLYWDQARLQVPNYALFQRLDLSLEDRRAQDAVLREAIECFDAFFAGADEVKITEDEHGMKSFSATIDLTKDEPK